MLTLCTLPYFNRKWTVIWRKEKPVFLSDKTNPRTKTTQYNPFQLLYKCRLLIYIYFLDHHLWHSNYKTCKSPFSCLFFSSTTSCWLSFKPISSNLLHSSVFLSACFYQQQLNGNLQINPVLKMYCSLARFKWFLSTTNNS